MTSKSFIYTTFSGKDLPFKLITKEINCASVVTNKIQTLKLCEGCSMVNAGGCGKMLLLLIPHIKTYTDIII